MHIESLTNLQAIAWVAGIIGFAWLLFRIIPSGNAPPPREQYSEGEIKAYDKDLPKYFLVAALALMLGGAHTIIKNLPGFWQWLWLAGYGGHLFRDLSNTHIIIVGGGTILLTAFTWYALPRFVNRPLYSTTLASMSFWFTLVGVFGFYLSWLVLGLVEGNMVAHGWAYLDAKAALGNWHKLPTAITSSIMGVGYWTYVLNVVFTAVVARRIRPKPKGYLTKFALVSAGGLFIGTVQGVIQVLPNNADWIRTAGKFGEYIDPISHAHVNLVTGVMMSMVAFLLFFGPRMGGRPISRRNANLIFWVLVPGSLIFYLTFLFLGLILGGMVNGHGGIQAPNLVPLISMNKAKLLGFAGAWMLTGFWIYFVTLWRSLGLHSIKEHVLKATPQGFWLVSSLALVVGTFQGMLQAIPATASILTIPEEVPNIHAQINMIGGIILALIGVVYLLLPELVGERADQKLTRYSLWGIGSGIGAYYLVTLITGLLRLGYLKQGMNDAQAAAHLGWAAPALLVVTAVPMFLGYLAFAYALWQATPVYRREWADHLRHIPDRYNGPAPRLRRHFPIGYFLGAEAAGAVVGFPGLGWILSGQALVGVPLALTGPAIAWAVVPILMDPYGSGQLAALGIYAPIIYLGTSSLLSIGFLWLSLTRRSRSVETQ